MADDRITDGMIFKPAPDITAYELARLIQLTGRLTYTMSARQVAAWPRPLQRHFRAIT